MRQHQQQNTYDFSQHQQAKLNDHQNGRNRGEVPAAVMPNSQPNFQINIQQYFISQQNPSHQSQSQQRYQQQQQNLLKNNQNRHNAISEDNLNSGAAPQQLASGGKSSQEKEFFQYYQNQTNPRKQKQSSSQQRLMQSNEIKTRERQGGMELSKMKKMDDQLQFDHLAKAQAQAQQSRYQSQEPRGNTKVIQNLNEDSSECSSSSSVGKFGSFMKEKQYSANNEPVSVYHQVSGEDLRKIIFFQGDGNGKEKFKEFKQLMVLYQNEIKKRWDERAQIKNTYKFPRVKAKKAAEPAIKLQTEVKMELPDKAQMLKNKLSPNPMMKKGLPFTNRTHTNNSQLSSQRSQHSKQNSNITSSRNQTSKTNFLMIHRKITQQNPSVHQSKLINEISQISNQRKSKQKSAPRVHSSKPESCRVDQSTNRSKQHSRANTQMSINMPNKFEQNNPIMNSSTLNRDNEKSVSAQDVMKQNLQSNLQKQTFNSRNISLIQGDQKGQNLSMPINGKSMQTQMTNKTDNSLKISAQMPQQQNTGNNKGPKPQMDENRKLQQHFKSMQNFMPQDSQPSVGQLNGQLSNDSNLKFHQQMPSIQVEGQNQQYNNIQNPDDPEKRQNLDYVKQRLQEMVHERQNKADQKQKKSKYKGRMVQQSQYHSKMPNVFHQSNTTSQPKIMPNQHIQNVNNQENNSSSRFQSNNIGNQASTHQQPMLQQKYPDRQQNQQTSFTSHQN